MPTPENRRCLVLGGSGHVGSAVCRTLAAQGARVTFTYFQGEQKAKLLAAEGMKAVRLDLRDYTAVSRLVEETAREEGGLDALIQCAGTAGDPALYQPGAVASHGKFLGITESGWDEMMDVTVKSTFAACQAAARVMKQGGQIVVVGSMDGVKTVPAPIHYAAAKGALKAMVQALAKELGEAGILVNLVAPGILDGGLGKLLSRELLDEYVRHCSLNRLGTADEVASLAAWLVLENTYVTAQAILLDGGL